MKLLIQGRADLDGIDGRGYTPLHRALENGHEAIARLLIDKGGGRQGSDQEWMDGTGQVTFFRFVFQGFVQSPMFFYYLCFKERAWEIQGVPATEPCSPWGVLDRFKYGWYPADLFVFELGEGGKAVVVEVPVLKKTLRRDGKGC